MNGKSVFIEQCKALGIDYNTYFIIGESGITKTNRYVQKCDCRKRKDSQLFAIKYITNKNVFIAWDLKEYKARLKSYFSILKRNVKVPINDEIIIMKKGIEFPSWRLEDVYIFNNDGIEKFLKTYIIKEKTEE